MKFSNDVTRYELVIPQQEFVLLNFDLVWTLHRATAVFYKMLKFDQLSIKFYLKKKNLLKKKEEVIIITS